ncbi:MAG: hypothetical protein MZV70_41980, partial [Desulfobacterales bacterium]|nr:hypothetical protein [Desulfobacterales bacterium]
SKCSRINDNAIQIGVPTPAMQHRHYCGSDAEFCFNATALLRTPSIEYSFKKRAMFCSTKFPGRINRAIKDIVFH